MGIKQFLSSPKTHNIASIVFLFLLSCLVGYFIFSQTHLSHSYPLPQPINQSPPSTPAPLPTLSDQPDKVKTLSILLLGYGGAGHQGGFLTDVIIEAHFDFEKKILAFISIPRDLWLQFPDGYSRKINAAYIKDPQALTTPEPNSLSGLLSAQLISSITDLPINYYIAIDFVGFERAIGLVLNGIEVDVPETLDDPWYPIKGEELNPCDHTPEEITELTNTLSGFELEKQFPCRYEHLHFDQGPTIMEGGDALKFVRSRHSTSDFSRAARQQAVLIGIRNKLLDLNSLNQSVQFFQNIIPHLQTDLDGNIVNYLAPLLINVKNLKIVNVTLSTENVLTSSKASTGAFILIPQSGENNWSATHQYIQQQILRQTQ